MKFFNRFIPWVCFAIVSLSFLMVINHYTDVLNTMPKWQEKKGDITIPTLFFRILCIFYLVPFLEISGLGLFDGDHCCEKITPNFEFFGIRSLVMLFQAICLSIIYFIPLYFMSQDAGPITTCILGIFYLIWLVVGGISYAHEGPISIFWNAQDYIKDLVDYYDDLLEKENRLKDYLKNAKF